jgi:hypothetical protein
VTLAHGSPVRIGSPRFLWGILAGVSTGLVRGTIWYSCSCGTTGEAGRVLVATGTVLLNRHKMRGLGPNRETDPSVECLKAPSTRIVRSLFPFDRTTEQSGQDYSPINNQDESANQMGNRNRGFLPRLRTDCSCLSGCNGKHLASTPPRIHHLGQHNGPCQPGTSDEYSCRHSALRNRETQDNKTSDEEHDAVCCELNVCGEGKSGKWSCGDGHSPNKADQHIERTLTEV